ncbi:hypothetical protein CLF_113347, partial [Clonorchis sinensis]
TPLSQSHSVPYTEPDTAPPAVGPDLFNQLSTHPPPILKTPPRTPTPTSYYPTFSYQVPPVLNSTVSEVIKFLLSTVYSPTSLSIMLFNARSLLPKIHNLRAISAIAQPSVICVTETWLTDETPDTAVSLPGYDIHRSDRKNSRGGGCAIYSKTELRATPFVDSSLEGIPETTWISTERTKRPVLVGCIYLPPAPSPDSIADLSRIISTAHALP